MAGCNPYATDTITILRDATCHILPARFRSFSGILSSGNKNAELQWAITNNSTVRSFVIESRIDGGAFVEAGITQANGSLKDDASYNFNYDIPFGTSSFIEFRIRMINQDGSFSYSRILRINAKQTSTTGIAIAPNPVRGKFQMTISSSSDTKVLFVDMQGRTVSVINQMLKKGTNIFAVEINKNWQPGVYNALLKINQETLTTRFVVLE